MIQGSVPSLDFRDLNETPLKRRFLHEDIKKSRWAQLGFVEVGKNTGANTFGGLAFFVG